MRRRLAKLPFRQDHHGRRHDRLERIRRRLRLSRRRRRDPAACRRAWSARTRCSTSESMPSYSRRPVRLPAASSPRRSAQSKTRCSTSRPRCSACPAMNCSAARFATASASTGRIARPGGSIIPTWYKPPITDLDGVKAIGREVREKKFTALKTNIFTYDDGKPQGWRPGFGVAVRARDQCRPQGAARSAHASRSDPRRRRTRCRYPARPQLQRQDRRLSEDPARDRRPRHVLGRDRQLQSARRWAISAARARTRFHPARRCSACANSCPISANRRWTSPSSTRRGTGYGSR